MLAEDRSQFTVCLKSSHFRLSMPRLDNHSHAILLSAGYRYCDAQDKYFNDGIPAWDVAEKVRQGRVQGAFPSSTIDEFREQELVWINEQKVKIKSLKMSSKCQEVAVPEPGE